MQLDKTGIAIRERAMLDTMDLTLHVIRVHFLPIGATFAVGAVPLFLFNDLALVGWMARPLNLEYYTYDDGWMIARFLWDMSLLVFLQAQLASIFTTAYLGQAVFLHPPTLGKLVLEVLGFSGRLFWCQLLLRGVLPACLFMLTIGAEDDVSAVTEFLLLPGLAMYAATMRAFRPFINEIVLLEKNPLFSKTEPPITIGRRSSRLHGPSGGDLFARWLGAALLAVCLVLIVYGGFVFCYGVLTGNWNYPPLLVRYFLPASMWLVACYFSVVRFLNYLDLRIRQEGWEVELRMRAEAARLPFPTARKPT